MIKFLGVLDILAALSFIVSALLFQIPLLIYIFGIYLMIKGAIFIFSKDLASILDIIAGLILISSLTINLPWFIVMITSLFLVQKGIFSLL